jgi:predicted peptidase
MLARSFLGLAFLVVVSGAAAADKEERGFIEKVYKDAEGNEAKYWVFIPHDYQTDKTYPVILFLHGGGESGTDGKKPLRAYLGPAIKKQEKTFPFIVVWPQSQKGTFRGDSPDAKRALAILDEVMKAYKVDPKRQLLAGGSLGGYGTWSIALHYPDRWAAIVPICGGGDPKQADKIKDIPCWCFHGELDKGVSVENSRKMIAALKEAGGKPKYTEYEGAGHDIGNMVWGTKELYDWLLEQKRK